MSDEEHVNDAPDTSQEDVQDGQQGEANESVEELTELEQLQQQNQEYLSGWKRAQADYQNLQKDTQKRISEHIKFATEDLLHQLLPMVDHFKYAFKGIPEAERDSNWLKGIEYIQQNFMKVLEEHGVEVVPTVGEEFNPELHEAIEEVEGGKSGVIAEEMSSGFKLNGKVIQVAKVKVYK